MKAIGVTDQAAGTAGMTLVERPEPQAATNLASAVMNLLTNAFKYTPAGGHVVL